MSQVDELLRAGRLERVPADPAAARERLEACEYAVAVVEDPTGAVRRFQAMRIKRNRSEYQDQPVGSREVETDLRRARSIVAAVRLDLGRG